MNEYKKIVEESVHEINKQLAKENNILHDTDFEIFGEKYTITQQIKNITASTLFVIEYETNEGKRVQEIAARFAHDGIIMEPGDIMETHWFIARILN